MITTVYLSNENIQIILGESGKGKALIRQVYELTAPDECLINGVITDETRLAECLETFWREVKLPVKKVHLVINSSQMGVKPLELPRLKKGELTEVLDKEFADVDRRNDPIYSYHVLEEGKTSGKLLATMAERSFVDSYVRLFTKIGVEVEGIDTALSCAVRMLEQIDVLKNETCVIQLMDDNNLTSILWINGKYEYSSRTRLFSDHGTPSLGDEVRRTVNNLMQFYASMKREEPVRQVYMGGLPSMDLEYCQEGMRSLGLEMRTLDEAAAVQLPELKPGKGLGDYIFALGSFFAHKGDWNILRSYKKKAGQDEERRKTRKALMPIGVILGASVISFGALTAVQTIKQNQADEVFAYLMDPMNMEKQSESLVMEQQIADLSNRITNATKVKEALASYPKVNHTVEDAIAQAGQETVKTRIKSYEGGEGALTLGATASKVEDINQFIGKLQTLDIFRKVEYSGYAFDEARSVYNINVVCYLASNAEKQEEQQ